MILVAREFYEPVYDVPAELHGRALVESEKRKVSKSGELSSFKPKQKIVEIISSVTRRRKYIASHGTVCSNHINYN